ncbi:Zinc-binding dehydrogenase [Bosea sp. CRIB-10]|nr:Zinc-binding dehydrogenase [Bosea sp. CRIB-10]
MWFMARRVFATSRKTGVSYYRFLTESDGAQLAGIARLVDEDRIKPVIDQVFPFESLPAAFAHLGTGRAKGKVVLSMT